jgi:hypothetical protein
MEIEKIHMKHLRNDEHHQLCTDMNVLLQEANPTELRFRTKFTLFLNSFSLENEAIKKISRSAITPQIQEADHDRDEIFRGLASASLAASRHYTPAIREAGTRLQIIFNTYGNVAAKPIAGQTSAVSRLVDDLSTTHAADVETAGLKGWVDELGKRNSVVAALMRDRYNESAALTDIVLRDARLATDEAYRNMTRRIDALAEIAYEDEPDMVEKYDTLIRRMNAVIGRANDIMAGRRGRSGDNPDRPAPGPDVPDEAKE